MNRFTRLTVLAATAIVLAGAAVAITAPAASAYPDGHENGGTHNQSLIVDSDAGGPTIRFDDHGNAIDAHDGEIQHFGNHYYLYGTSYGCGTEWQTPGSPFCGFRSYSSTDLVHWTDRGSLFDATSAIWQARCDGSTYGCYRPHVVYNAATHRYVLWFNSYDVAVGYHVLTSASPSGPFVDGPVPHLGVNDDIAPGVNNGDEDVFVDTDGTAYLVFTDWKAGGELVVEKLDSSYTSGTGQFVRLGTRSTEAPSMFTRDGRYYVTYSDPNCGYCTTGTSYLSAPSPMGPWTGAGVTPDTWTVADGTLTAAGGGVGLSRAGADWTDYTMSFRTTPLPTGGGGTYAQAGWVFRATDGGSGYQWLLGNYPYAGAEHGSLTKLVVRNGAIVSNQLVPLPFPIVSGQTYDVATTVAGSTITTVVNGVTVDVTTDSAFGSGKIGFRESGGTDNESARFDDVQVTAPDGTVLMSDDFSAGLNQWDRPAPTVLGTKLSTTSCGGQPADVAELPGRDGPVYLYQSDRWNSGAANQALALQYWEPLRFDSAGNIAPLQCAASYQVPITRHGSPARPSSHFIESAGDQGFHPYCDTRSSIQRAQTFTVHRPGTLRTVSYTSAQSGHPNGPLTLTLVRLTAAGLPGSAVASTTIAAGAVSWSPAWVTLHTRTPVRPGDAFALIASSTATQGCYGTAYSDDDPYPAGGALYSRDGGTTWTPESGRDLHVRAVVLPGLGRP